MASTPRLGIDIGSTTIKLVALDDNDKLVYKDYQRHRSAIEETLNMMLKKASEQLGGHEWQLAMAGSAALAVAESAGLPFVQEVVACAAAVRLYMPTAKTVIELGGEDAKITFFDQNLEQRMNGVCAGGTGSFIDHMAALLNTDPLGLNELAANHRKIYSLASRCGVFAKTDVQALLNEGAEKADIAASVMQAVVNQTVTSLAQGRRIIAPVALLGGPLYFLPELRERFRLTLNCSEQQILASSEGLYFVAAGAALTASGRTYSWKELTAALAEQTASGAVESERLPALFTTSDEYTEFCQRHAQSDIGRADLGNYSGQAYLGIDAGSTTTKIVLLSEQSELLYSYYSSNHGDPLNTVRLALIELYKRMNKSTVIAHATVTGYGEQLLKAAFLLDSGEVETVAHLTAASHFQPNVSFVLDIGGQDMKCLAVENGVIKSIVLNEACSAGCGSFIENFAGSLGLPLPQFVNEALTATSPVDLGTRCTVFMNSKVKQAQKEGAKVGDICAGIAISVVRNALYKVIRLRDSSELGDSIVVQGGTFLNDAVLRAFEQHIGREVVRPVVAGLMGALGAALLARQRGEQGSCSTLINADKLVNWQQKYSIERCGLCNNNCQLTRHDFGGGRMFVSGNRCERGAGQTTAKQQLPDLYREKYRLLFSAPKRELTDAPRGEIGLPRALNMYEDYRFWHRLLSELGYRVVLSTASSARLYEKGMDSIPSETLCYPAKMVHGHIADLISRGVKKIFYPCVVYAEKSGIAHDNHYNCPVVVSYPENIRANMEIIAEQGVTLYYPFLPLHDKKALAKRLRQEMASSEGWSMVEIERAIFLATVEQAEYKAAVRQAGDNALQYMRQHNLKGIVLAGRPYHIDPAINHGLPQMLTGLGLVVFSEDSLSHLAAGKRKLRVVDQWEYHSRLYAAAEFVASQPDLQLVQLNSFGCGLDAITIDQTEEILRPAGKIHTVIKLDDINNLGAARIRIRSLLAAMKTPLPTLATAVVSKTVGKYEKGFTIIAPEMSPIHSPFLSSAFARYGHKMVVPDYDPASINNGLKYVHNDSCYPALVVIGQLLTELQSGKYDLARTAVILTQTCGGCRATNYVPLLRKAMLDAELATVPVIAIGGKESNPLKLGLGFLRIAVQALLLGDLLQRLIYRVRPYEFELGTADDLYAYWQRRCCDWLAGDGCGNFSQLVAAIVQAFESFPIRNIARKPRVGIVGEILVKYHPAANNNLAAWLEREGAEVAAADMAEFFLYCAYDGTVKHQLLGGSWGEKIAGQVFIQLVEYYRSKIRRQLKGSKRFALPSKLNDLIELVKPHMALGHMSGEGWLLTAEILEFVHVGVENVVCVQPFGCLPNHITGKGMMKELRRQYPQLNIAAIDYDPGASEVNQVNRLKLMLAIDAERKVKAV